MGVEGVHWMKCQRGRGKATFVKWDVRVLREVSLRKWQWCRQNTTAPRKLMEEIANGGRWLEGIALSCIIFCSDLAPTLLRPAPMFLVTVTLPQPFSDPAPTSLTFLATVTMLWPCSDLALMSLMFLVTLSQPSWCSDLTPMFLVTPSQYYNSGHSLL